jgi:hypothetical protein
VRDLLREALDASTDLVGGEVDRADPWIDAGRALVEG